MCTYIFYFQILWKIAELNKNKFRYCLQGLHFRTFKWHTSYKKYSVTEWKIRVTRDSEKENKRVLTSNNCCHLLKFMLMQSIVMDLVRLSKYWKWHLKDAYEYCSPSKKLITSTFSLYLRPNKKYVVHEMR